MVQAMDEEQRVKLAWAVGNIADGIGNAYGYTVHNRTLYKYVDRIAEIANDAKDVVWIIGPELFRHAEGRNNWLFTMFEGRTIPDKYIEPIGKAEFLLAPTTWVKELFARYFDTPCFVVQHGVETHFAYKKRVFPRSKPFRFLWVGAPNARKGWQEVAAVWSKIFADRPEFELYVKTTRVEGVEKRGNTILDGRNLSMEDLVKLYHSAHAFLFPTRGEGFGLTLAEAMRTGLPCISPFYSGVTDFFDDRVGYTIGHSFGEAEITFIGDGTKEKTEVAYPHVNDLAERMVEVYEDYKGALKKGARASQRIVTKFTWERSAQTLVDLIREHGDG